MRARIVTCAAAVLLAGCSAVAVDQTGTTGLRDPAPSTPPGTSPPGVDAVVEEVLDGDSLRVLLDGAVREVRLSGINAPERDECHGDAARSALSALVNGATVRLAAVDGDDTDQFGRLLRDVYTGTVFVNLALVEQGDALALQAGNTTEDQLLAAEERAFAARLGLWARDACGPATDTPAEIVDVVYNPPGRDDENQDDEWVVIRNDGSGPADLSGWTLRDESTQHRFVFARETTLPAGGTLRVRSGCGVDRDLDFGWCAGDPVWSNGGDTALLLDENGNVVSRYLYRGDF